MSNNVTLEDDEQVLDVELESFFVPVQQDIIHIGTTAYWNAQPQFVAENGHVYVYSDYTSIDEENVPAIKIGDGTSLLINLPFVSGNNTELSEHIANAVRHITAEERILWNGKQDELTAGENITIENNVISASGGGAVDSVNGKTGVVVLDASDVGALPDTTTASDLGAYVKPSSGIPKTDLASAVQTSLNKADTALQSAPVTSVNTKTGAVVLTASDVGAYTLPSGGIPKSDLSSAVQTSLGKADTALQSAPVTSVNSKTGAVSLSASDVGALPSSTAIPTKTSDLTNDSGFLTSAVTTFNGQSGAVTYTAPVQSVNGQTGAVTVSVPTKTSDLQNDSGYITSAPVSSVDGKTGAVTVIPTGGTTGQVLAKASDTDRDVEWTTPASGGGSEWRLITDLTLTEDVSSINITEDEDGNSLALKAFRVFALVPKCTQASIGQWGVNSYWLDSTGQFNTSTSRHGSIEMELNPDNTATTLIEEFGLGTYNNTRYSSMNLGWYNGNIVDMRTFPNGFNAIRLRQSNTSYVMPAGTRVFVYGVDL